MSSLYGVLGIPRDADKARVKSAFRSLAKAYHPDHRGGDEQRFREISHAYGILVNPERRAAYDAERRARARQRLKSAVATMAASFMLTVGSGVFVAGWLLGV